MQLNRTARTWAAVFVVFAVIWQVVIFWIHWDEITFGPNGTGTKVIIDLLGPKAPPFMVALYLEYAVRGAILLALGLIVFGISETGQPSRERRLAQLQNPFA